MSKRKEHEPPYETIKRVLHRRILEGDLQPGAFLGTEDTLRREFGVSRYALRRALDFLERAGFLQRVQGKGTFVRPTLAPARTQGTNGDFPAVALIVPFVHGRYEAAILEGVERVARLHGFHLVVANAKHNWLVEQQLIGRMRADGVQGIVLYPCEETVWNPALEEAVAQGYPVVLVDRSVPGVSCDTVTSDNAAAMEASVLHLARLGHRRVGLVTGRQVVTSPVLERYIGYRRGLLKADLPFAEDQVLRYDTSWAPWKASDTEDLDELRRYLKGKDRPTAVCCLHDMYAMDVYAVAAELGLRIPADLSVVGFDDTLPVAQIDPPLTTNRQQGEEIGVRACERLLERMRSPHLPPERLVLPAALLERGSTAPPAGRRAEDLEGGRRGEAGWQRPDMRPAARG